MALAKHSDKGNTQGAEWNILAFMGISRRVVFRGYDPLLRTLAVSSFITVVIAYPPSCQKRRLSDFQTKLTAGLQCIN